MPIGISMMSLPDWPLDALHRGIKQRRNAYGHFYDVTAGLAPRAKARGII